MAVWTIDQGLKRMGELVNDAIGNSWLTDAIVNGFKGIWETLFDPVDGWLRWLTLTWWTDRFAELKTWWNGGQVLIDTFNSALDFGSAIFGSILTFVEELPGKLAGIGSSLVGAVNLSAIFGIEAFKAGWNAIAETMNETVIAISIPGFEQSIGFGRTVGWAGWSTEFGMGTWPTFDTGGGGGGGSVVNVEQQKQARNNALMEQDAARRAEIQNATSGTGGLFSSTSQSHSGQDMILQPEEHMGLTRSSSGMGYSLATGGYVKAMSSGGYLGNGSYLVGERGPELFSPSSSGQVINNSRTESILKNQMKNSRMNAGTGSGGTMFVDNLVSNVSSMGKSKISVDTFAGVI